MQLQKKQKFVDQKERANTQKDNYAYIDLPNSDVQRVRDNYIDVLNLWRCS